AEYDQSEFIRAKQFDEQEDSCEAAVEQYFFEDFAESDQERDPGQVHKKMGNSKGSREVSEKVHLWVEKEGEKDEEGNERYGG
ncbi:hypothetical protein J0674_24540, partial [Vibrio parahaemolyticus]